MSGSFMSHPFRSAFLQYLLLIGFCLIFGCGAAALEQQQVSLSYDEMVSGCEPWVSVKVQIPGENDLRTETLSLSTSSIVNQKMRIYTVGASNSTADGRLSQVPCLYQGSGGGSLESVFASEFAGRLEMTFKHKGSWYRAVQVEGTPAPAVAEPFELHERDIGSRCRYIEPPSAYKYKLDVRPDSAGNTRKRRSVNLGSFGDKSVRKALELVIVADSSFVRKAGSEISAIARVLRISNYLNAIYNPLDLRIVLSDIVVWHRDLINITSNAGATLNNFTVYKANHLSMLHDTVMLLSALEFRGGKTLGLAWMKGLCSRVYSVGLVSDKYPEAISPALTLAHEIGHNLGFSHVDETTGCICNSLKTCVMHSNLNDRLQVLDWSSCSRDAWNQQADAHWRACLSDAPENSYHNIRGHSSCGNGILERGEQCDCGTVKTCSSKCCDAATCRLKPGAACASGACCDSATCSLKPRGSVCRTAVGPCDLPETCSGSGEWCPSDDKLADGIDCGGGQAFCYRGQCGNSTAQCQRLFLSSSARPAPGVCFSVLNTKGYLYGYCKEHLMSVRDDRSTNYSYVGCAQRDAECGLLHCHRVGRQYDGTEVRISSARCHSRPLIDLSSSGQRSPSMVPNGAKCGVDSMCLNSKCTPLSAVTRCPDCPNCHGNGLLTVRGVCFCKAGFQPPDCVIPGGCGGSVTSPLACP